MSLMNRLATSHNQYQGKYKRVLCVCSAGVLRSPTAAFVLSLEPYNFNTRAAGITKEYALVPVDDVLLNWADEVVFMQEWQRMEAIERFPDAMDGKATKVLNIDDMYEYRDPALIEIVKAAYDAQDAQRI